MISRNSCRNCAPRKKTDMDKATDERWMRVALNLAGRGLGHVWPNPAVGCVLVRDGRLVGQGWTRRGGRPHAEVVALQQAGAQAAGATAYVTLEPCAHHGKTPPCALALVKAGVARVVGALEDPDPRVSGKGYALLQEAGIEVTRNILMQDASELNRGFLLNRTIGRPLFTLKMAATLDGAIATAQGESRWITGPAARRRVHMLRATHDAVMIGAGTARADDPMLDVRDLGLAADNPVRVVLDGGLSLALTSRLAKTARDVPLWIFHRAGLDRARITAWQDAGARLFAVTHTPSGELDLPDVAAKLAQAGITRVLCEGGGRLAASLVKGDLVDRLVVFSAGKLLGADGWNVFGPLGVEHLAQAPRFTLQSHTQVGADIMTLWTPAAR